MAREVRDMVGFTMAATDGDIGHVMDFYFDDEAWVIRYLIVETGSWMSNRKALVSPMALREPNRDLGKFSAWLTREQVRNRDSWAIRNLIVNIGNWWQGHQVLVGPEWITDVSWLDRKVMIDLTRQAIQDAPSYEPALLPYRPQESLEFEHNGR